MSEDLPEPEDVTFFRFCADVLQYELTPWQRAWAYRITRCDRRIGFNFRPSDSQQALELLALSMLFSGIIEGQISYVLCAGRGFGREFNSIALGLLNQSRRLSAMVSVHKERDFFKCGEHVFGIVIDKKTPLPTVEGGWDLFLFENTAIPGRRQVEAMEKADRIYYPNLSPKASCASRPKLRKRN